ncbi:MAG: hypothetical protein ABW352_15080 [Polyangiales bacterium]
MASERDAFWAWFSANAARLQELARTDASEVANEVGDQLQQLGVPLQPEIGVSPVGPVELVLHTEGNRERFELARTFVRHAPTLAGWEYTALRPAMGFELSLRYQGHELDAKELWFLPLPSAQEPTRLGVRLGLPRYAAEHEDALWTGSMILLSSALGEASAVEDIDSLEVVQLPEQPRTQGYLPLHELPATLAQRKRGA